MPSSFELFKAAFGGEPSPKQAAEGGQALGPDARSGLFRTAFSSVSKEMPTPNFRGWRLNPTKAAKLSFSELHLLQALVDSQTPYSQLPAWVRDGGYVVADDKTRKAEKALEAETGLTTTERQEVYSLFSAQVGALAEMCNREILKDSPLLLQELERAFETFGQEEVMDELKASYPEAAQHLTAKVQANAAEAKAQEVAAQQDVAAEIKAAQEAIAAENAAKGQELAEISADELRAELLRRDAVSRGADAEGE